MTATRMIEDHFDSTVDGTVGARMRTIERFAPLVARAGNVDAGRTAA